MKKVRILVVDDAVVIRRMVSDLLAAEPQFEVVGSAPNGRLALQKIPQVNPDIVTLDIEMPELNGIETVRELRKLYPKLPVIMFSTLSERGASATIEALAAGANDYVTKPANVGSAALAIQRVREELVPKIRALTGCPATSESGPDITPPPARVASPIALKSSSNKTIDAVVIGVSTGGPNALAEVIPELPQHFPVPIFIVQHMPPLFTKYLADRLKTKSKINVEEGSSGKVPEAGNVYIAPGGKHMTVERLGAQVVLGLNEDPPENSCRPAVDVLMRSVAQIYGAHTLALVLTGMGSDGLRGCEAVRQAGGEVFVQDEASSVVWGMPGFVARAGLAAKVLPLRHIGNEITRRVQLGRESQTMAQVRPTSKEAGVT